MSTSKIHFISSPLANLRREPIENKLDYEKDILQESQVLYGERISIKTVQNDWLYIEALEQQKCFNNNTWQAYPGWIKSSQAKPLASEAEPNLVVSMLWADIHEEPNFVSPVIMSVSFSTYFVGTKKYNEWWELILPDGNKGFILTQSITQLNEKRSPAELRQSIVRYSKRFLGSPYFWGGRSAYAADKRNMLTSVDCSGLTNLLYRVHGITIPRDAHDQYLKSEKLDPSKLQLGDLIFVAKAATPDKIYHVMLYIDQNQLLEATAISGNVRMISCQERLKGSLLDTPNGGTNGESVFYYGTFL